MSKKCPYIKVISTKQNFDGKTIIEELGDCGKTDCPYYTMDDDCPSFCIRAQRPDDDAPEPVQSSIGFLIGNSAVKRNGNA